MNDLKNLLSYVERKKRLIEHERDFVIDILPRMERLKASAQFQPKVHYFEGKEGVETVMYDSLNRKDANTPILCITSVDKWLTSDMKDFIGHYIHTRLFIKEIPIKVLVKDTDKARCFLKERYECERQLSDVLYVRGSDDLFDNEINIYDNKVAIVSPERNYEFGVLIESEEFARTQKSIFDLAWKGAMIQNEEYGKIGRHGRGESDRSELEN